jgi:hypothetical protein
VSARRVLGVVLLAVITASCGLGDKQHRADAIIDSVDRLFDARTAVGTLGLRVGVVKVPDVGRQAENAQRAGPRPGPGVGELSPPLVAGVALDFAHRRAVVARGERNAEIFDDQDYYGTRVGISERDARPWLRLRLSDLEEGNGEIRVPDDSPLALGAAVNPIVLIDLAAGALAGSIERGVPDKVGDVPVTRYRARFDVEKTLDNTREDSYPEDQRDAIDTLFSLLTIKGTVNEGTAWLDAQGRLRRFRLLLRASRQRDLVFGVEFDLRLLVLGKPVDVKVPDDTSILEADSVVAFLRSTVPELHEQVRA